MTLLSIWSAILHWIEVTSTGDIIGCSLAWAFGGALYIFFGFVIFERTIRNTYLRCIVFSLWPLCVAILIIGLPFILLYHLSTERK